MFITQVSCTTISITWRIIGFTCILISITSVVYLIFKWWRCLFWIMFFSSMILSSFALLLGLSRSWILYFPLIKVSEIFFLLIVLEIRSLSGDTVVIIVPGLYILERLGLSLLTFISFGWLMLILSSNKLAYEIYLELFSVFTVSSV